MGVVRLKSGFRVVRRSLGAGHTLVLDLPRPLSVNNLFLNVNGRGRVPTPAYTAWRNLVAQEINIQRPAHISGPVEMKITVKEGRADLDGQAKCLIDAIVDAGVITDDNHSILRKLTLEWGDVAGARVEISRVAA